MRFLILGEGAEAEAWAETIRATPDHRVAAAWPAIPGVEGAPRDLDEALAWREIDAAVVGGPIPFRDETLRRIASAGIHAIALHPPGVNADPYYQVALSREETGAVVVPALPIRALPDLAAELPRGGDAGLEIELETVVPPGDDDLVIVELSRWTDLVRLALGEIESVSAFGEPPGPSPTRRLSAQFRAANGGRAEIRVARGAPRAAILTVVSNGERTRIDLTGRLDDDAGRRGLLDALADAVAKRPAVPTLTDGTRAMEIAEGVAKSLRKGRTVDLHYERVSEENNFKSVMTSLGCMILLSILVALPLSLAGPALGLPWLLYVSYAIPPVLIGFGLVQLLRFGIQRPEE